MRRFVIACAASLTLATVATAQQAADAVAPETATEGAFAAASPAVAEALAAKREGRPVVARDWMIVAGQPACGRGRGCDPGRWWKRRRRHGRRAGRAGAGGAAKLGPWRRRLPGLVRCAERAADNAGRARKPPPLAATPTLFQDDTGEPLGFFDAVVGGRSVGTPGTPALLAEAHRRWGRQRLADIVRRRHRPGRGRLCRLSKAGRAGGPRCRTPGAVPGHGVVFPARWPAGDAGAGSDETPPMPTRCANWPARGPRSFIPAPSPPTSCAGCRALRATPACCPRWTCRYTRCASARPSACPTARMTSCGMGPPSSGALTVGQILGLLDTRALPGPQDPEAWRLIGDAARLAFADRGRYMADADFVPMPTKGLIDPAYLARRAELLSGDDALPEVSPGQPEFDHALNWADDEAIEFPSTSHITIVDRFGNVLSMTTTIENALRVAADGARVPAEQRVDRFFLSHPPQRRAHRQPGRAGQAAALLDGADHRDEGRSPGPRPSAPPAAAGSSAMSPRR